MLKVKRQNFKWADINMREIELDKLILHFIQCMKAEGKSAKTVSWYEEMLSVFTRYLDSSGTTPVLVRFNLENIRAFIISEQKRGMSPFTVQARVSISRTTPLKGGN